MKDNNFGSYHYLNSKLATRKSKFQKELLTLIFDAVF